MDGNEFIFRDVPESCSVDKCYAVNEFTKPRKDTVISSSIRQKVQNANKRISDYFPLRWFWGAFFIFILL